MLTGLGEPRRNFRMNVGILLVGILFVGLFRSAVSNVNVPNDPFGFFKHCDFSSWDKLALNSR